MNSSSLLRRPVPLTSSSGQHIAAAAAAAAAAEHAVASPAAEHLACRSLPEDTFTLRSVHLFTFPPRWRALVRCRHFLPVGDCCRRGFLRRASTTVSRLPL